MDLPTPKTWSNDEVVTAVDFNANIRDPLRFMLNPPRVSVWSDTATVAGATGTFDLTGGFKMMTWNQVKFDSDNMFRNDNKLHVSTAGVYEVILHVEWQYTGNSNGGNRYICVNRNDIGTTGAFGLATEIGADMIYCRPGLHEAQINHLSFHYQFNEGDYITASVRNTLDAQLATHPTSKPQSLTYFSMLWVGRGT